MNKKPIDTIFLDFDEVIFDLRRFNADLRRTIVDFGVPQEFIERYYSKEMPRIDSGISKTYYLLSNLEVIVEEDIDFDGLRVTMDKFFNTANEYVFDDVECFLQQYFDKKIHILTCGCPYLQELKIRYSKILSRINGDVIIADLQKSQALRKHFGQCQPDYSKSIFVDDQVNNINDVKKFFRRISVFLMDRTRYSCLSNKDGNCNFRVSGMNEISDFIY